MTLYNIIDFILIFIIIFLTYYFYKEKSYLKIFDYFKIFFILTLSAKFSSKTAVLLQDFYITKADTYTTLIIISFIVNLTILYFSWKYIFIFLRKFINSEKIKTLLSKVFTLLEVSILVTLILYILMQFYPSKKYIYPSFAKTFSYKKIEKFYMNFLNDDFTKMILNQDTSTNHKELLFKSFKQSF